MKPFIAMDNPDHTKKELKEFNKRYGYIMNGPLDNDFKEVLINQMIRIYNLKLGEMK